VRKRILLLIVALLRQSGWELHIRVRVFVVVSMAASTPLAMMIDDMHGAARIQAHCVKLVAVLNPPNLCRICYNVQVQGLWTQ
jgi:hypothetical protein